MTYLDLLDADLPRTPAGQPSGGEAQTVTAGVNWYLTDFARPVVDYTRFRARSAVGPWSRGDLFGARFAVFW